MPRPSPASQPVNILVSFVHQHLAMAMANSNPNAWAIIVIINNARCSNVLIYYVTHFGGNTKEGQLFMVKCEY